MAAGARSPSRLTPARWAAWLVVIVGGLASSLAMEVSGWYVSPAFVRPEVAYQTLHSAVPWVFGICAIVGLQLGEKRLPIIMMVGLTYLWIPQLFFSVIDEVGWLWPLVQSVDLAWALLLGMIALAYPRGRFVGRVDWAIVIVGVGASLARLAFVLSSDSATRATCACAPSPYGFWGDLTTFLVGDLVYRIFGAVLVAFVAVRQFVGWARGSSPTRSVAFVMPIGLLAWLLALIVEAVSFGTTAAPDQRTAGLVVTTTSGPVSIVSLFAVASIPICYIAGSVHLRNTRGRVADLMSITRDGADRELWRDSLASTLGDPGLEVYWWDDARGAYTDSDSQRVELPVEADAPTKTLLPITAGDGSPIAVIRHDRALTENTRLLDGVSTALRLTVDNGELRTELQRTLAQVRESRQRIVEASDETRKRLERDLHDGSQQQLVALAIQLRTIVSAADAAGRTELAHELESALDRLGIALRELRELARGIHPTALVEGGLPLALPELASRCPVPVVTDVDLPERMPELVEATAWFVTAECLANIARHSSARQAWLRAESDDEELRLSIRDNGVGGASTSDGSGMTGLADRVEAIGGTLELQSYRGEGTTIRVRLPLAPAAEPELA